MVSTVGQTLEAGLFVEGSIHIAGASGHAELSIPLFGERGRGIIFIIADKHSGGWEPRVIVFKNSLSGERTNLLQERLPSIQEQ